MKLIVISLSLIFLLLVAVLALRFSDMHADKQEWQRLLALQSKKPALYDPQMVAGLPEPAQRFFNYAIKPGTPLLTVAEIDMGGEFSLGSRDNPDYQNMQAKQILAAPEGFVWQMRLLNNMMFVSGSDSGQWTRFRILGLIPVARIGGDADHRRSAFGRYVAEAVFWTPAALLPGPGIVWEVVDNNTARVIVNHEGLSQAVDVSVNDEGQPTEVSFMRWSNANADKEHRLQPFGGRLSDFREVQGFRVPFYVEAGNMFGTEEEFVFFKAELLSVNFPEKQQ